MPALQEKDAKIKALGIHYDPKKFPELLPEDETFANYLRHRTMADVAVMNREDEPNEGSDLESEMAEGGNQRVSIAKEFG